jgi:hypothetical protein
MDDEDEKERMKSDDIRKTTQPQLLSRLMDLDVGEAPGWGKDELGAILRHQLSVPLLSGLGAALGELDRSLASSGAFQGLGAMSFGDLLRHPRPPVEALKLVKDCAKLMRTEKPPLIPQDVALVLYYASIAAADLRLGVPISKLDAPSLGKGVRWALSQAWLDEPTRSLFTEELRRLEGAGAPRPSS